ncbi:hypothetical protein [Pedobacter nanyangensis]|uniref:hypothetical protein n=1 Tax=Pedobacter nanyangensis TaxID=1562389 RepID=UPI0013B3EDC9|nr:hypothetical protein [Pedobacter nanyangensis]
MKTTKNIWKLTAVILFTVLGFVNAQAQEKTVYGYGFAYSYDTKVLYISNIVSGVKNSETYHDASDAALNAQWLAKMKTEDSKYFNYKMDKVGFMEDKGKVDEDRTAWIGKFKQQGFTIQYLTFSFKKDKKD